MQLSRRDVLRLAVTGTLGAFLAACQHATEPPTGSSKPALQPTQDFITQVAPTPTVVSSAPDSVPITPNSGFYRIAAGPDPNIPPDWKLALTGLVNQPLTLTLDEIKAMPSVTEMRTLECIENPVGGWLISNAVWSGVRLKDLLARVGVGSQAHYLQLDSVDGYLTGIPLELGMDDHALLVYEMNGVPLPPEHGAPLRCLWPGRYGMKQPKWLQTITLVEKMYTGYWEMQGWSRDASVRPFSRIDSPREGDVAPGATFTLSGIAYTDDSGLARVEVSWDDTDEWQPAELTRGPSPYTWTAWKWTGRALPPGRHKLYARATDGSGQKQTRDRVSNYLGGAFPDGTVQMQWVELIFES
jgi:DMSO/TMAO reductase YedYZ molybdopterin-dependent catalytic subunit